MGGRSEVDPGRLRASADAVLHAAEVMAGTRTPTLDADALPHSAVCHTAAPDVIAARVSDLIAQLRDWAGAAHASADAFDAAEHGNAERFGR